MSYFLTNLIVENTQNTNVVTIEKDEQFQKQYSDTYDSLSALDEHLRDLNRSVRNSNPKLYFLSDVCLLELYSYIADQPAEAIEMIRFCYESISGFIYKEKKEVLNDSSPKKEQPKILLEIIGFKNGFGENYNFDRPLNITEKQSASLEFLGFVVKHLDDLPTTIRKSFFTFFNSAMTTNNFNWAGYCKSMLSGLDKIQNVYLFMELCFYHNLTISLEMDDINKESLPPTFSKKQYILADISDEETIRSHKLKFFYEKMCKVLTEVSNPKKFNEEINKDPVFSLLKHSLFVLEMIKFKDIVENFIQMNVCENHNFNYLALPKLCMGFDKEFIEKNSIRPQDVVDSTIRKVKTYYEKLPENGHSIEADSEFLRLGMKGDFDLTVNSMNYKVSYGFQPILNADQWVYVPQTPQYLLALLAATSSASSALVCGAGNIGKKSLLKVSFVSFCS